MPRTLLETLTGNGDVYAGDVLLRRTQYQISVYANKSEAEVRGVSSGTEIEGHIDITGIGEAVVLAGPEALTLRLEDGRRLLFTLAGTDGRIVGKGLMPR